MNFETISFVVLEGSGYLTFNRPQVRNAINMKMIEELEQVIEHVQQSDEIGVLLISGVGNSFCAGADTTEFLSGTAEANQEFLSRFGEMVKGIEDLAIPVIGVINGYAFGGGAEIAIACDFRIAAPESSFRFPGASYGLVVSSHSLPTIVGAPKAKELLFRSCIISADEALRIGLVDQIIEYEELDLYSKRVAEEIRSNSLPAIKKIKETINLGIGSSIDEQRELEDQANQYLINNTNYRETFSSFVEKRKKSKM